MYCLNGAVRNVLGSVIFSVWERFKGEKMMIFGGGSASYLYIITWNRKEYEGYNPSHRQDSRKVRRDFPSILQSLVKFLWVEKTHRNVFLATWRPRSRARDRGGRSGVPDVFWTKRFQNRKVCWNSAKLLLGGKLRLTILNKTMIHK